MVRIPIDARTPIACTASSGQLEEQIASFAAAVAAAVPCARGARRAR
jgi:hypothetical protein